MLLNFSLMPVYLSRNIILFDSFKDIQQSARRLWEARRICFEKRYCLLCLLTSFSLEHTLITCSCVVCTHHAVTFKYLFFFTWLSDVSSHLSVHSISPCFPVRRFCFGSNPACVSHAKGIQLLDSSHEFVSNPCCFCFVKPLDFAHFLFLVLFPCLSTSASTNGNRY